MGSRLDRIKDWEDLAHEARYRVNAIARRLKVSRQTLHSRLNESLGCSPRLWIESLRLRRAGVLFLENRPCKEIAYELGMTPSSMCRLFQRTIGCAPESYRLKTMLDRQGLASRQFKPPAAKLPPRAHPLDAALAE